MRACSCLAVLLVTAAASVGCSGGGSAPAPPACDGACQDAVALYALRETVKLVYNATLQGNPVGPQHVGPTACPGPGAGTVEITGYATSDAQLGLTELAGDGGAPGLTYVFHHCTYGQIDSNPNQSFEVTLDGTLSETGVIAVQPTATTALSFQSDAFALSGTVYDPPIPYALAPEPGASGGGAPGDGGADGSDAGDGAGVAGTGCALSLTQNGNQLSGTICGRSAGVTL
jgi:hypothetical protein